MYHLRDITVEINKPISVMSQYYYGLLISKPQLQLF